MGKLISFIHVTPDGFCSHTMGIVDDEMHLFANDMARRAGMALFGRVTFGLFEGFWPKALRDRSLPAPMQEFARLIDGTSKVVFSRTLREVDWNDSRLMRSADAETIGRLKQTSSQDLVIFGSPGLLSDLARQGLIDEYYFLIAPVLGGRGIRLFENTGLENKKGLKLLDHRVFQSGTMVLHYGG